MGRNAAKVAARRAESGGGGGSAPPGAELELKKGEEEQIEKQIARAMRLVRPMLDDEGEPGQGGSAFLAASLVAYAADKLPSGRGQATAWCRVLGDVLGDAAAILDEDDNDDAIRRVVDELVRKAVLVVPEEEIEAGSPVLALLAEDEDWHEAVVEKVLSKDRFVVVFLEYGKPQETSKADIRTMQAVVDDEGAEESLQEGKCEMCERQLLLTFHHLIPKDTHPTYLKKRLPPGIDGEPTRHFLNSYGTMVCRQCHSFVHRLASNEVLAREYNTLPKILENAAIQRWIQWIAQRPKKGF